MTKSAKNLLIVFCIGIIVFVIGSAIDNGFNYSSTNAFLVDFLFYELYSFVLGYTNMYYFDFLEKRQWNKGDSIKRIIIGIVGSTGLTLIGLFVLRLLTSMIINGNSFAQFLANESFASYLFGLWITLTIVIIFQRMF